MSAGQLSAIKLALAARALWAQDGALRQSEPIAVVGMACRLPGGIRDPEAFWSLLLRGGDAITEVPADRWDLTEWYDADPATPGRISTRYGGFLDDVRGFDAAFFDIGAREAERMDPQQRLALEVACEAFEHAGFALDALRGSATNVYFSSYHNDYTLLQYGDPESVSGRTLTGAMHSIIPNRISYVLGLRGASLTVDSACSSSLVGVHLACQALRGRECETALVGGVNLVITPHVTVALSRGGFMSASGHCWAFEASADGFIRGEGCGAVVLKRLSDAIAAGDRVLAVIRGSAVNQDGRSTILSAPNGLAQAELIRAALRNAGLEPADISLLEAHGTGTQLGDPIEADALVSVFAGRDAGRGPCWLGSLKANVGHLEAAAGIAGLIKAILCLRHATVPPQAMFERQNQHIDLSGSPLRIARQAVPLDGPRPLRAGVSSFGVGGTNAHVVIEETPAELRAPADPGTSPPYLLPVSARSEASQRDLAAHYARQLAQGTEAGALACAAARRTQHAEVRATVLAGSAGALAAELERLADGRRASSVRERGASSPPLCFVFSGQGTQWPGMGRELRAEWPAFAQSLERIDAVFAAQGELRPLRELNRPAGESRLERTDVAQATIFAVQIALAEVLGQYGIRPSCVIGHSAGELAAAVAAGLLTLEAGVSAVLARGAAMQTAFDTGRMLAARLSEQAAAAFLERHALPLSIAALNGPASIVLSGPVSAVEEARALLAGEGVKHELLGVRFGFHSVLMQGPAAQLRSRRQVLAAGERTGRFISTVTGGELKRFDFQYLADNVAQPVRFHAAVRRALDLGTRHFIEVGPHPALGGAVLETAAADGCEAQVACAHRERAARSTLLALLGKLFEWGCDLDWQRLYPGRRPEVDLPPYPWDHQPYWLPEPSRQATTASSAAAAPALPGRRLSSPLLGRPVFQLDADHPVFACFEDHRVGGAVRVPATALLALLLEAGRAAGMACPALRAVALLRGIEPAAISALQLALPEAGAKAAEVHVQSAAGEWQLATTAEVSEQTSPGDVTKAFAGTHAAVLAPELPAAELYEALAAAGLEFGPGYRLLREIRADGECARGDIAGEQASPWSGEFNPAVLDAAAHLCMAVLARGAGGALPLLLPSSLHAWHLLGEGTIAGARAVLRQRTSESAGFDVFLVDALERPLIWLEGWELRRAAPVYSALREASWTECAAGGPREARGGWLVLGRGGALGNHVARELEQAGASVTRLAPGDDPLLEGVLTSNGWRGVIVLAAEPATPDQSGAGLVEQATRSCAPLLALARLAAAGRASPGRVLLVTRGVQAVSAGAPQEVVSPAPAAALGVLRSLRAEFPELRASAIDLSAGGDWADDAAHVVAEALAPGIAPEVAVRAGRRLVHGSALNELRGAFTAGEAEVVLQHTRPGTLEGFELVPRTEAATAPGADQVRIRMLAAGLNFRDVLIALGSYPGAAEIGMEGCGMVEATGDDVRGFEPGQRVLVFSPGCFATHVTAPAAFVFPAPPGLEPAAAATLPIAFGTAWYALHELALVQPGQSVLVHAGAGGVGQAAVQLALAGGAVVFATASTPAKRRLLERLGVAGAFDSRSASFESDVLAAIGGRGVDVVINSLTGALLAAGLRCLAPGGLFIELGKRELLSPAEVAQQRSDVRYAAFDLREAALEDPGLPPRIFAELRELLAAGTIRPLPCRALPLHRAGEAFRQMARGQHTGKLVLLPPPVAPRFDDGWCVLTGGTGGMAHDTLGWLLRAGARRVALWSRSGSPPAASMLELAAQAGAQLTAAAVDVGDAAQVEAALAQLRRTAPVTGVVHAAAVLDDGPLAQLTPERLADVLRPKLAGAWNLHRATQGDPITAFVLFSSAGPLVDATGTGTYAAANALLDALAVQRRQAGLPAVSIRWGLYRGGMSERLDEAHRQRWERAGLDWLDRERGEAAFRAALRAEAPVVYALAGQSTSTRPAAAAARSAGMATERSAQLGARLQALSPQQRGSEVLQLVRQTVRTLLGTSALPDPEVPLRDLGMDSLTAIELRNTLTVAAGNSLPATLAFDYPNAAAIAQFLLQQLGLSEAEQRAPAPGSEESWREMASPAPDAVDALSDEEAEALLLRELAQLRTEEEAE